MKSKEKKIIIAKRWCCDFCDKPGLSISISGLIYCRLCKRTYDETLYDLARKLLREQE